MNKAYNLKKKKDKTFSLISGKIVKKSLWVVSTKPVNVKIIRNILKNSEIPTFHRKIILISLNQAHSMSEVNELKP